MVMNLMGPRTVPIETLKVSFFARTALDENHILYLADLYEHGVNVDPIIINEQHEVIDGRHRLEAMRLLNKQECLALIAKGMTPQESLIEALRANMKGPKPPSTADVYHIITSLLNMGLRRTQVTAMLPYPPSLIKKYMNVVMKREQRKVLAGIIDEILTGNISLNDAAEKYGIGVSIIRDALDARKAKNTLDMSHVYSAIEKRVRSTSHQMSAASRELITAFHDGVVGKQDLAVFVAKISESTRKMKRTAERISERVTMASNGTSPKIEDDEESENGNDAQE